MIRKLCVALVAVAFIAAIMPESMAASNGMAPSGAQPYKGLVGADSPLYGFKLFVQKVDISLTGNTSIRLHKMLLYGDERLAEACAAMIANNTGAMQAALNEYTSQLQAINGTMDDESIDDLTYIDAGQELDAQENNLTGLINNSSITPATQDLLNQTLNSTRQIKSGRPFIYYNNTSYFIPPGQMKNLDWSHVPPGLEKKGYQAPAPLIVNGSVLWPWDEGYSLRLNNMGNETMPLNNTSCVMPVVKQHGNGKNKDKVNGNGNGNGKK
jgi:hypothetical protein